VLKLKIKKIVNYKPGLPCISQGTSSSSSSSS